MKLKNKFLNSIPLLIGFLFLTQIAKGQISYLDTPKFGRQICVPVDFMDTLIHDLKERKVLLRKDSLSKAYISILSEDNGNRQTKIYEQEKTILILQKKKARNGWQRNLFILSTIFLGYLCIR